MCTWGTLLHLLITKWETAIKPLQHTTVYELHKAKNIKPKQPASNLRGCLTFMLFATHQYPWQPSRTWTT